jgi:hypothetical protein
MSELALEQGDLENAEQLLIKAHQLSSQVSADSIKSETALLLVNIFIQKHNYPAAKQLLAEAAPEPEKLAGYLQRKHLALSAELAASEQQWQLAYQLEKSANQLEVAELNDTSKVQLDNLQSSLALQMQQEKQQQLHITQQTQLKQWLLLSAALLAFAVFMLILLYGRQKKVQANALIQAPQWRGFTELLLHHHKSKTSGQLLAIVPAQATILLNKGVQHVMTDLQEFRTLLDKAMFWVEQEQEFWLYCSSEQQALELQHKLLASLPPGYQTHSAIFPLHTLLSKRITEQDVDALRELLWYSLFLAQQQGLQGALTFSYQCKQNRPCSWQADNLRQDIFNAISLGLLAVQVNDVSLSDKLQKQLAQI